MVNNMWQQNARGGQQSCSSSVQQPSINNRSNQHQTNRGMPSGSQMAPQNLANPNSHTAWNVEKTSATQRQQSYSSYQSDNGHYPREARFHDHNPDWHYRGNREPEYRQDQTSHHSRNWEHEYNAQREFSRGGRWRGNRQ